MAPRTLASLAHSLAVAPNLGGAIGVLGEALAELDRGAHLAYFRYDGRRELLTDRLSPTSVGAARPTQLEVAFDQLPVPVRQGIAAGASFIDVVERAADFARLLGLPPVENATLAIRGLRFDGALGGVLTLVEPKKFFGGRTVEKFAPTAALFDLAFARFAEAEARREAVVTLESVTQRIHGEYDRRLGELEAAMSSQQVQAVTDGADRARIVQLERETSRIEEDARRFQRRAESLQKQLESALGQTEQAHIELHRRNEELRERERTVYLIDRVLSMDASAPDPRQLAEELLTLVGEDMQAQRVSLMMRAPEPGMLYLAAARGVARDVSDGYRVAIGSGVAGKVAASRQVILVTDATQASQHPLLKDEYFTSGSFICFPLVYREDLIGVVNVANRNQQGVFTEADVDRVRLLGLIIALVATQAQLSDRLLPELSAT
jgi:hypothetical protein